ncbi:MAG: hypothetical protein ACRD26_10665 [Vicinamibacterales bacterium]
MGLLILRLVLACHLITEGSARVAFAAERRISNPVELIVESALALAGALVVAGFLTPVVLTLLAVVLASLSGFRILSLAPELTTGAFWSSGVIDAAIASSLALLGPGAYSIDAYLFGRQEVVIPPRTSPPIR